MTGVSLRDIASLAGSTFRNWQNDRAPRLGAALAYYMALSLAPTVVIVLAVAGWAFGAKAAEGRLVWQIQDLVGLEGAKVIQTMIAGAHRPSRGAAATLFGLVTLFLGATAVIGELQDALNTIWKVPDATSFSTGRSILNWVKERLIFLGMIMGAGLLLLASLIVNLWMSVAGRYLESVAPPPHIFIQVADGVISFIVIAGLTAFIFKVLPNVPLVWADVTVGAVLTSLLFTLGKFLLGLYLGRAGFTDTYGAAGSLVILLVWIYYSAQVFYLGAEFTRVYACRFGTRIEGGREAPLCASVK